ncbi:MAG: AbrB/MazE/SpoVT family DNA-binding domain-containing protein [bacterium]|nr:AbrB/MazE/SpoVT family DNA-binding domain-containing protein [bacterium]
MVETTQIVRYGRNEAFIPFPAEWCKKWNIKEGDDVDVSYDKEKEAIVIKFLK